MQRSLHLQEAVQGVLPMQAEEGGAALRAVSVGKQETRLRRRMQESQRKGIVTDSLLVRPSFQSRFYVPILFQVVEEKQSEESWLKEEEERLARQELERFEKQSGEGKVYMRGW